MAGICVDVNGGLVVNHMVMYQVKVISAQNAAWCYLNILT